MNAPKAVIGSNAVSAGDQSPGKGKDDARYVCDMADELDLTVLSEAERAEYARLSAAMQGGQRIPIAAAICCSLATLGLFTIALLNSSNWQDTLIDDIAGWLGLGVGLFGGSWVRSLFQDAAHEQRKASQEITGYLNRIGYHRRVDQRHSAGHASDDGGYESKSRRQMQHEWYGDHGELNWTHRVQGEALGFDNADDYVDNFLEHDKD